MSGILFIVSGPSGAGKSTISTRLRAEFPELTDSVSYTTRAPRGEERDGVDYHFVDAETFQRMIDEDEFVEWAEVHGNRYGTAAHTITQALGARKNVLFDIDYQGATSLRAIFPDAVTTMLLPPSIEELERRLRERNTDDNAVIERRVEGAYAEIQQAGAFDYVVVNDVLEEAADEIRAIYLAAKSTLRQQRETLRERFDIDVER